MADIGNVAVEKLSGKWREYKAYEGSATAQTPGEYDWGTADSGAYTYATPIKSDDFVVWDTTADFRVKKAGATDQGKTICGIALGSPQGKTGTVRECRIIHFADWDVLLVKMKAGATSVVVGDMVSLGAIDATAPHGFTVDKDATNGFGHCLNAAAAGEHVALLLKPGKHSLV